MKANITIEQAKERAPKWLWRKMEHTIELLQKAGATGVVLGRG